MKKSSRSKRSLKAKANHSLSHQSSYWGMSALAVPVLFLIGFLCVAALIFLALWLLFGLLKWPQWLGFRLSYRATTRHQSTCHTGNQRRTAKPYLPREEGRGRRNQGTTAGSYAKIYQRHANSKTRISTQLIRNDQPQWTDML